MAILLCRVFALAVFCFLGLVQRSRAEARGDVVNQEALGLDFTNAGNLDYSGNPNSHVSGAIATNEPIPYHPTVPNKFLQRPNYAPCLADADCDYKNSICCENPAGSPEEKDYRYCCPITAMCGPGTDGQYCACVTSAVTATVYSTVSLTSTLSSVTALPGTTSYQTTTTTIIKSITVSNADVSTSVRWVTVTAAANAAKSHLPPITHFGAVPTRFQVSPSSAAPWLVKDDPPVVKPSSALKPVEKEVRNTYSRDLCTVQTTETTFSTRTIRKTALAVVTSRYPVTRTIISTAVTTTTIALDAKTTTTVTSTTTEPAPTQETTTQLQLQTQTRVPTSKYNRYGYSAPNLRH